MTQKELEAKFEDLAKSVKDKLDDLENTSLQVAQVLERANQMLDEISEKTQGIDGIAELRGALGEVADELHEVRNKVEGRNKSAPTKRNMTDQDALEVLKGKWAELSHKEAAEASGLTYAQVYSCRLEFTFKHVHKTLRDEKWINPWAKK